MTELPDAPTDLPEAAPVLPVGEEPVPDDNYDTGPRPEDGEQDVSQEPEYEETETDENDDQDDPEVHEVG